jgi:hypothetical protein
MRIIRKTWPSSSRLVGGVRERPDRIPIREVVIFPHPDEEIRTLSQPLGQARHYGEKFELFDRLGHVHLEARG